MKTLKNNERKMLFTYLFYTFAIAWGTELLLIAAYHFGLPDNGAALVFHFAVIGFGAGMAPAYAAFIVQKKYAGISFKESCKQIFHTKNLRKTVLTGSLWAAVLIHAWGNTVLGGMYTLTSLTDFPSVKTLTVYGVQAAVILILHAFYQHYSST